MKNKKCPQSMGRLFGVDSASYRRYGIKISHNTPSLIQKQYIVGQKWGFVKKIRHFKWEDENLDEDAHGW